MKGLLHSKRFKQNLAKWLFMYVGVMLLLTTVVTYSRYISSMHTKEDARPAQFDVAIEYDKNNLVCEDLTNCFSGTFRPTSKLEYTFTVDTTKIEVNTDFVLTVTLHEDFKIESLKNITNNTDIALTDAEKNNLKPTSISSKIYAPSGKTETYKIVVYYGKPINKDTDFTNIHEIVKVGYSAKQITRGA